MSATQAFDADRRWRLHERVALRPEPFGALAYHYGNRRLTFLRSPDLVTLVEQLPTQPSARAAFDAAGIEGRRWPSFEKALTVARRRRLHRPRRPREPRGLRMTALTDQLAQGLNSPICLTWEWTYACNLQCVHCLSSSRAAVTPPS